jgi:hypothetical protein
MPIELTLNPGLAQASLVPTSTGAAILLARRSWNTAESVLALLRDRELLRCGCSRQRHRVPSAGPRLDRLIPARSHLRRGFDRWITDRLAPCSPPRQIEVVSSGCWWSRLAQPRASQTGCESCLNAYPAIPCSCGGLFARLIPRFARVPGGPRSLQDRSRPVEGHADVTLSKMPRPD